MILRIRIFAFVLALVLLLARTSKQADHETRRNFLVEVIQYTQPQDSLLYETAWYDSKSLLRHHCDDEGASKITCVFCDYLGKYRNWQREFRGHSNLIDLDKDATIGPLRQKMRPGFETRQSIVACSVPEKFGVVQFRLGYFVPGPHEFDTLQAQLVGYMYLDAATGRSKLIDYFKVDPASDRSSDDLGFLDSSLTWFYYPGAHSVRRWSLETGKIDSIPGESIVIVPANGNRFATYCRSKETFTLWDQSLRKLAEVRAMQRWVPKSTIMADSLTMLYVASSWDTGYPVTELYMIDFGKNLHRKLMVLPSACQLIAVKEIN
jgi:hypothetical protein